ncbi:MAG: 30S ribosomal protein S9 [Dehalococcoidia bacterium]|nr:30S ribosomal protein S9 [Dehalococcoidia bacterium]
MAEKSGDQRQYFYGLGRRKSAVARVRLYAAQEEQGSVVINGRPAREYLGRDSLMQDVLQPLQQLELESRFDVVAKVLGGGMSGQAGAVRHGIARALLVVDPEHRRPLRQAGLLTRDSRVKERKKYGLKRARKAPQYTKR